MRRKTRQARNAQEGSIPTGKKAALMNDVEKHELFEQGRKIFEAGVQRADKRSGSFNFLTWSFFIARLIACEEFLVATFKSAAAELEVAKTAQAGTASQAANDDPPAIDPSKTGAEDETNKTPAASSEARASQLDPGLSAQPHDDALKPSPAHSKTVAAEGSDVAEHNAQTSIDSIDDSSVNSLSADSYLGSVQIQGGSTAESVQSNVLGDSFSSSMIGSAHLLGTVGTLSNSSSNNDVDNTIAPVEAAVQPVLASVTETAGTLTNDVGANTIAPVAAAVQPVLASVTETAGTLTDDVGANTIAPVTGDVAQSVSAVSDALADAAPVVETTEPVLTTTAATLSDPTSDVSNPADTGTVVSDALADAAPVVETTEPVLTTTPATLSDPTSDVSNPADTGTVVSDALADAAPVVETTEPVLATTPATLSDPT